MSTGNKARALLEPRPGVSRHAWRTRRLSPLRLTSFPAGNLGQYELNQDKTDYCGHAPRPHLRCEGRKYYLLQDSCQKAQKSRLWLNLLFK